MVEKKRILHVFGRLNRGGAETMIMNLYREIDKSKFDFDFVIHTKDLCEFNTEIEEMGGKIHSITPFNGINLLRYIAEWHNLFRNHPEYKIIHGHMRSTATIYLTIAKKYGLKTIAHSHNTSSGHGIKAFVKTILQYPIRFIAEYFFACSIDSGIWLFGKKVCNQKNFRIIKNSINTRQFTYDKTQREYMRSQLGIKDNFVIGHIGRFEEQKNHLFLIDIFYEYYKLDNKAILLLIGTGENEFKIKERVKKLNLEKNVVFLGVRNDVPALFHIMDIFIFPSKYEGLPVVLIEAQAAGLNIFASDTITKEVQVTNLIQWLSLSNTPKVWAKRVYDSTLCIRKDRVNEIVQAEYDIYENVKKLENIYLEILSN